MVLNGDSTHPNPWRPPNDYQNLWRIYYPDNIYKGSPTTFKPSYNWFNENTLSWKLFVAFKKGFVLGSGMSCLEIFMLNKDHTPRAKLGRYLYITVPITSLFVSYIAAKELASSISEKMGKERDSKLTYCLATLAPASIWATWKKMRGAVHIVVLGSIMGCVYREMKLAGFDLVNTDPRRYSETEFSRFFPADGWKWKGWSFYDTGDEGPAWKKWVDK